MPLTPGTKIGPYEVLAPLGAGGMGEVYKAKDTRLERTVALKVLPSELSDDPERRQRLEREARAVSSLNHPHICTLYDIGTEDGVDFLVMEYIEGETLHDRLRKGPLPLDQALRHGIEIADALDKAHRQGIVHRDLKPGNIIIARPGAKLLDFGLAKQNRSPLSGDSRSSALPTEAKPLTEKGAILGTFQYMAPEQLEGKEADARTDIFAFGALLYEMVTGQKAFEGESQASLIGAIMNAQPKPASERVAASPPLLDHVIQTCLAKDREDRWQSAADVGRNLSWLTSAPATEPTNASTSWRALVVAGIVGAIIAGAGAGAAAWLTRDGASEPTTGRVEFFMPLPETDEFPALVWTPAISPDGRLLVYAAIRDNVQQLFKRSMSSIEIEPIPGTEGAGAPFFSPDGEWIGFSADDKLKKISVNGGAPITVLDGLPFLALGGASWSPDGSIVVTTQSGFARVPSDGGDLTEIIARGSGSALFGSPAVLPSGNGFVFADVDLSAAEEDATINIVPFDTNGPRTLLHGAQPSYSQTGHVVFSREGSLWAAPFDENRLELSGPPFALATMVGSRYQGSPYAIGGDGTLAYTPGAMERRLSWVDRAGHVETLDVPTASYLSPRLSPDGNLVAVEFEGEGSIMILDLRRGGRTRLSESFVGTPVWTPDGRGVAAFTASGSGASITIAVHPADGRGEPNVVVTRPLPVPGDWTPDGETLAFHEISGGANRDIWLVSGSGEPVPYVATPANERSPRFSADGRFLAYVSDVSGRDEVYVETFPERSDRLPISTEGGIQPVWSPVGNELFYRYGNRMMSVTVTTSPELAASRPKVLFEGRYATGNPNNPNYTVSRDGKRFLMVEDDPKSLGFQIVLNAFEGAAPTH